MKINYKLIPLGKEYKKMDMKDSATGFILLNELELAPDAYIITRDGTPIPMDEKLKEGDNIGVIKIVSGG